MMTENKTKDNSCFSSSEELFIEAFLKKNEINFKREFSLNQLHGDTKKFRKADFFLPDLNLYMEYFGLYNSTKKIREEYDEKAAVYIKNNIPTIFIYPHELGILDYAFHAKALKLLKIEKFNLKKELFKYRLNRFMGNDGGYYIGIFLLILISCWALIKIDSGLSDNLLAFIFIEGFFFAVYILYNIFKNIRDYFYKDK